MRVQYEQFQFAAAYVKENQLHFDNSILLTEALQLVTIQ